MIVDELILKLQADLADVKKGLAQVKVDAEKTGKEAGEKMGKAAGTSFGDVFQAVAGAVVVNSVKNFFSRAATEFNKFEAAFLRVDSIAKGFNRSVVEARKQVEQLADKGFLNLNQAASSYADAIALGFDEKQARKFIDSLSDIAAFQNTIGDGAAAVQSGLAGLLSNSAEKVENIGVPVKVLNMQYNENIKTMGKAAALQKFYNGILVESSKFTGDAARAVDTLAGAQNKANAATDKAMVAIGKGLEPILKRLFNTIEDGAKIFAGWFNSLDSGTKTIAVMIPLIAAFTLALGPLLTVLRALSLANPFAWAAAAITAIGALAIALRELTAASRPEGIVKAYKESAKALGELGVRAKELESINKRTAIQEKELADIKENLRKKAKALGVDYDQLAKSAKSAADMTQMLTNVERERQASKLREQLSTAQRQRRIAEAGFGGFNEAQQTAIDVAVQSRGGMSRAQLVQKFAADERETVNALVELYQQGQTGGSAAQAAQAAAGKAQEQRFIESQSKLLEIEKNRLSTIANISKKISEEEQQRQRQNTDRDAEYQRQSLRGSFQQVFAEYIEDKRMADLNALSEQTRNAKRASEEQLTYELNLAGKNEKLIEEAKRNSRKRIAAIDEANARKRGQIELEAINRNAQAASATASGIAQIGKARDLGSALSGTSSIVSGVSQFSSKLQGLGVVGQTIGAVGSIVSVISGLFGKSDAERAREASEQARRDEEAKKILELQANYQKSMLALQEQQAKLPFENLQRQLRLIDIQAQRDIVSGGDAQEIERRRLAQRQQAISGTLQSESGAISGGQLFQGVEGTPESLTQFLNERNAQSLALQQFTQYASQLNSLLNTNGVSAQELLSLIDIMRSYKGKIPDAVFNSILTPGISSLYDFIKGTPVIKTLNLAAGSGRTSIGLSEISREAIEFFSGDMGIKFSEILQGIISGQQLSSEVAADTSIAENLLSTLEQSLANERAIAENTRETAENTAKVLQLRPDRERSFIDVGLGFIQSLGQRITSPTAVSIAQSLARQNLSLPTEIGTATVTSGLARTLQERMADALEKQLMQGATANDILRDIRAATVALLSVMDNDASTSNSLSLSEFTALQSEANRRRI